ncbi:hypothetical protein Closa_0767 [[Clostridium] saccharolyticum WM1]|uniref:Uncharacterized protein n=1 Tax=Lacrimispora saccharolytica (strain ATCC 35040 / DSM 2544 / NRCC 2533 / WM1) TaxID=610130 RepID=D9R5I6_LACSW|nr:hypothetical protein Closa_0767 [[Clostridium] saccharolyticum WM1]
MEKLLEHIKDGTQSKTKKFTNGGLITEYGVHL